MSLAYAYLLCAGALLYWLMDRATAEPRVDLCRGCGDLVSHIPGLPAWCPTCGRVLL